MQDFAAFLIVCLSQNTRPTRLLASASFCLSSTADQDVIEHEVGPISASSKNRKQSKQGLLRKFHNRRGLFRTTTLIRPTMMQSTSHSQSTTRHRAPPRNINAGANQQQQLSLFFFYLDRDGDCHLLCPRRWESRLILAEANK